MSTRRCTCACAREPLRQREARQLRPRRARAPAAVAYLRVWGRQTRAALEAMRATHPRSGYFAPSCIAHAHNLRFGSAPSVAGVRLIDGMHDWFFGDEGADAASPPRGGGGSRRYAMDACGDLPCRSNGTGAVGRRRKPRRARDDPCPILSSVRECRGPCMQARRRRRIRLGLNPEHAGHNVCSAGWAVWLGWLRVCVRTGVACVGRASGCVCKCVCLERAYLVCA